jgi:hypothetical protein
MRREVFPIFEKLKMLPPPKSKLSPYNSEFRLNFEIPNFYKPSFEVFKF